MSISHIHVNEQLQESTHMRSMPPTSPLNLSTNEPRAAFAHHYLEAWGHMQARRALMQDVLGMQLTPDVLPFATIAAYLPPFWRSQQQALHLVYEGGIQ